MFAVDSAVKVEATLTHIRNLNQVVLPLARPSNEGGLLWVSREVLQTAMDRLKASSHFSFRTNVTFMVRDARGWPVNVIERS